ncbi:Nuclear poly(A) polymerase 1 [Zea mays]|uniref:Nuclear poly(A) polymerase 1 n=1 Tax=Zea mays TaxID=4577 RepID=A0A3L6E7Y8_MAIZE|nr:Nuclear poly(A) polymerase 1 [Zea mays]
MVSAPPPSGPFPTSALNVAGQPWSKARGFAGFTKRALVAAGAAVVSSIPVNPLDVTKKPFVHRYVYQSLDIQLEKQLAKTWRSTRGRTTRDRGRTGRSNSPSFCQPKENHVPQQIAEHRRIMCGKSLTAKGYEVVSNGIDNHLVSVNLKNKEAKGTRAGLMGTTILAMTVLEETQLKFEEERQNLLKVLPNNSKELSVRRVCEGCGMSKVKNNNGYHGVTEPISLSGPTEKYLMQTAEVEKYLSDARLYERQDEAILREEVLGKLDQVEQFSTEIYYFASFKIFFSLAVVDEGTTSRCTFYLEMY